MPTAGLLSPLQRKRLAKVFVGTLDEPRTAYCAALPPADATLFFEIRYLDSFDLNGFTCPPSGANACNNLILGSLKATF
jgi:hypothetical protein